MVMDLMRPLIKPVPKGQTEFLFLTSGGEIRPVDAEAP